MLEAVIFDMDGLMLDTQRQALQVWKEAVREFGRLLEDEVNLAMVGRDVPDSDAILRAALGPGFPVETCRHRAEEMYLQSLQKGIPVKPGLAELLDFLENENVMFAVATSTPREVAVQNLTVTGLATRFSVVVAGDEVPRGKPAPDIFLAAAAKLRTAPEHCAVLEDSFPGIRAARAAGMVPIMVPDLMPPTAEILSLARTVVPSLHQAREVIARLLEEPFPS